MSTMEWSRRLLFFVGNDWAEKHHDVELQNESGKVLARAKLPEGVAGITKLHAMIGQHLRDEDEAEVIVGIETERGPWVQALVSAGYQVYPVNPLQVARFRERLGVSGAKSDTGDAHVLADMVRTFREQLRPIAGDSIEAQAIKVVTRAHKTLIWERTRHLLRLRHTLREFFPAALAAFDDLTAVDALELLAAAPDPASAAALSLDTIEAALKRARRRGRVAKAQAIAETLRAEYLGQPQAVAAAYAATVRAQVAILTVLNQQITTMGEQVDAHFSKHPDAKVYLSQPGHPPVRQEEGRSGPPRPQRPAPRRPRPASLRGAHQLTRRPRLLRPDPWPRSRPPRRTTPTRQPSCRHPPRLPQDRHAIQRSQSMAQPARSTSCRLTNKAMGCLTGGKTLARSPMTARRSRRVADNAGFKQVYEAGRLGGDAITRCAPPRREPRTRAPLSVPPDSQPVTTGRSLPRAYVRHGHGS